MVGAFAPFFIAATRRRRRWMENRRVYRQVARGIDDDDFEMEANIGTLIDSLEFLKAHEPQNWAKLAVGVRTARLEFAARRYCPPPKEFTQLLLPEQPTRCCSMIKDLVRIARC